MSLRGGLRFLWKRFFGGVRMLQPGDPAPDFDAIDHNGNRVKLGDLRGKKVVLWFYPKADTPG
jgi:peroxiredoxin Q/BCP